MLSLTNVLLWLILSWFGSDILCIKLVNAHGLWKDNDMLCIKLVNAHCLWWENLRLWLCYSPMSFLYACLVPFWVKALVLGW